MKRLATILGIFVLLLAPLAHAQQRWERTYGGAGNEGGNAVRQTQDGGYIVSGGTTSYGNGYQVYLVKTNASGDTLWTRTYGGAGSDEGYSVQQTQDTGYIVSGYTNSFGNFTQVYLIKTNASGDTLWTRYYGGMGEDVGYSAQQTSDGGYVVAGLTGFYPDYQVCLIKTNASGDTLWTKTYGGTGDDDGNSVQQTSDGGYIVAGRYDAFGTNPQVYLIKTDANGNVGVEENRQGDKETRRQGERLRATPNPFTSFASVPGHEGERFSLYDISGRKVGTYRGDRVGEGLSPGVYFLCQEGRRRKAD